MGKIRTRLIGDEEIEEKQKKEQKLRSQEKKLEKKSAKKGKKVEKETIVTKPQSDEVKVAPKTKKAILAKQRTRGKKYQDAKKHTDPKKQYELSVAVELLKKISYAKFDESIELHLNVLKDNMKGEVSLPHSTGKTLRVVIVDDQVLEKIEKGMLDFDIVSDFEFRNSDLRFLLCLHSH